MNVNDTRRYNLGKQYIIKIEDGKFQQSSYENVFSMNISHLRKVENEEKIQNVGFETTSSFSAQIGIILTLCRKIFSHLSSYLEGNLINDMPWKLNVRI